jgi:hypothetical protein
VLTASTLGVVGAPKVGEGIGRVVGVGVGVSVVGVSCVSIVDCVGVGVGVGVFGVCKVVVLLLTRIGLGGAF